MVGCLKGKVGLMLSVGIDLYLSQRPSIGRLINFDVDRKLLIYSVNTQTLMCMWGTVNVFVHNYD